MLSGFIQSVQYVNLYKNYAACSYYMVLYNGAGM